MVYLQDTDEFAKRFDNFMYGLILAQIAHMPSFAHARKQLCDIAISLERKISISQVKEKLSIIQEIGTEDFWKNQSTKENRCISETALFLAGKKNNAENI